MEEKYEEALQGGDWEKKEDLIYDFESVNERLWAIKEAEGRGSRGEFEAAKREKLEAEERERENEKDKKPKKGKPIKAGR